MAIWTSKPALWIRLTTDCLQGTAGESGTNQSLGMPGRDILAGMACALSGKRTNSWWWKKGRRKRRVLCIAVGVTDRTTVTAPHTLHGKKAGKVMV